MQHAQLYYAHDPYPPRPLVSPSLDPDPPHEREDVDKQIKALAGPMKGFINSYSRVYDPTKPGARLAGVMEYCTARNLPITDFLARNFTICDNWFAPLPASTLPNRLMAMSGYAEVDHTPDGVIDEIKNISLFAHDPPTLLYDWLEARGHSWRVYHAGTPFFVQVPRVLEKFENRLLFRPIRAER